MFLLPKRLKQKKSATRAELESLYKNVRNIRENKSADITLKEAFGAVTSNHPNDWLLCVEIAELTHSNNDNVFTDKVVAHLENLKQRRPEVAHLITNGLELIFEKISA